MYLSLIKDLKLELKAERDNREWIGLAGIHPGEKKNIFGECE